MAIIQRLATDEGLYLANSMNSLRLEGQKTASIEIAQQFDWQVPDVVIVPGGNLGNISAFAAGFEMMRELGLVSRVPRLVAAQAEARTRCISPRERLAVRAGGREADAGLGDSDWQSGVGPQGDRGAEAVRRHRRAGQRAGAGGCGGARGSHGMFACPHTGVALAALIKLAARGEIRRDERVVVISTASGLKFADFKADYHAGTTGGDRRRRRRTGRSSCQTITTRSAGSSTWRSRPDPGPYPGRSLDLTAV